MRTFRPIRILGRLAAVCGVTLPLLAAGQAATTGTTPATPLPPAANTSLPAPPVFVRATPQDIPWPTGDGVKTVILWGDPSKPGLYAVRNTFPPGVMSAPHYHDQDRFVTVIKGTWYTGTDAHWDPDTTIGLPAGSYMIHPKGAVHFDGAKDEETIVQIVGMGPVRTVPARNDTPRYGKPHRLE